MQNQLLLQGDCLQLMSEIPDKSIDLICCDLPYGCTNNPEDIPLDLDLLWKQYKRVIKDNGAIILFCQSKFFVDLVNSNRSWFRYDIVWDKQLITGHLNANKMPLRRHEQIAVFYKKLPTYNPQFTEGKPQHGRGKSYLNKEPKNQNYGEYKMIEDYRKGNTQKYPTSIIQIAKSHPAQTKHRTEKPIELYEWLIKTYSNENDIVLDNCMGSGNCGIAALKNNRRFVGIEKNPEIFKNAKENLDFYSEN